MVISFFFFLMLDLSQGFNVADNLSLISSSKYHISRFSRNEERKISPFQYSDNDGYYGVLSYRVSLKQSSRAFMGEDEESDGDKSSSADEENGDPIQMGQVKIDDGGSDLTDRFKYKVHALMGDYDPPDNQANDEYADGNILNAMMTFPTKYSFHVVGRTGGDDVVSMEYIEQVRNVVKSNCSDPQQVICDNVTPRGNSYLKVTVHGMVESAAMINAIYDELDALEMTKMRF
jgi:putative lipoic acid-binding regulatory protein